jgi:hypothetical protein
MPENIISYTVEEVEDSGWYWSFDGEEPPKSGPFLSRAIADAAALMAVQEAVAELVKQQLGL